MGKNRLAYLSLYRGMEKTKVTVVRDKYRKVYECPTYTSLARICNVVSAEVALGKMGLSLWPEGFWANPLRERR